MSYIRDRFFEVKKNAHAVISNKDLMAKHLWRTKPCKYGLNCRNIETCCGAHFKSEYRVPTCLYQEFCEKKGCEFYHSHMGTAEQYMDFMGVKFEYNTPEECLSRTQKLQEELKKKQKELDEKFIFAQNTRPLVVTPKIENKTGEEKKNDDRAFTRLCRHMKSNRPCKFSGCQFAHSIEQLVLPKCDREMCGCTRFHLGEDKAVVAERYLGVKIHGFMLRPAWMNNGFLKAMKQEEDFFEIERQLEKGVSQNESEPQADTQVEVEGKYDESDDESYESDDESETENKEETKNSNLKYLESPIFGKYCVVVNWGDEVDE
jgi:hypothetical protein